MIHLIIFDLDGTIVENEIPFSEMRERIMKKINCEENPPHLYEFLKEKGDKYLKILKEEEIRRAKHARVVSSLPTILNYLKEREIKRAILTRNSRRATLIALGKYVKEFDSIITRDDEFEPKPSDEGIIYLLSKFGVKNNECMVVGDYEYDIIAGKKAGCITVRIGNGEGDYKIEKIEDIVNLIEKIDDYS